MAVIPPNNNYGDYNTDQYAAVPWNEVLPTNNTTIDRGSMPYASTVEFKGYYKATATGSHTFSLTGTSGVTGYAWISSAPKNSDHIIVGARNITTVSQKSYGLIFPLARSANWPWQDPNVVGTTYPGDGYWPRRNYGTQAKWTQYFSGKIGTDCGFSQTTHQYFLPGDIRTYADNYPLYQGQVGGPSWMGPEDPHFTSACWPGSQSRPLVRLTNTFTTNSDPSARPSTPGKTSQVFMDTSFKAEGFDNENFGTFEIVDRPADTEDVYVWLRPVGLSGTGIKQPERIQIRFGLRIKEAATYKFYWKTKDALKMWYHMNTNDAREMRKFPDNEGGANPCNKFSSNTNSTGWEPNGGEDSFTGTLDIPANGYLVLHGYGCGQPDQSTAGFSLVIKKIEDDNSETTVWDTEQLLMSDTEALVGIDECGYHALLDQDERIADNKNTEFYTNDGWQGYFTTEPPVFMADKVAGDQKERDPTTTRQYLWSNSLVKTRGGESIPGSVYLRQGDFYFIRAIVSNSVDEAASYNFKVTAPGSGFASTVSFSGNGDPNSDSSVGGPALGSGIPIRPEILCDQNGPFFPGGTATSNDTNFAIIPKLSAVVNLTAMGVQDYAIGLEGQQGVIDGNETTGEPASFSVTFDNGDGTSEDITITQLVRSGTGGIPNFTTAQISAILNVVGNQIDAGQTYDYNTFRNAITSQAVINWGVGGNYPYIFHAVSDVITSICTDTEIIVPERLAGAAAAQSTSRVSKTLSNEPQCIDVDYTQLSAGAGQITSECFDECKDPTEYPLLTKEYTYSNNDYQSFASGWADRIIAKPEASFQSTGRIVQRGADGINPVPGYKGDFPVHINYAALGRTESVLFPPGKIVSIPWTVSDVVFPDGWDVFGEEILMSCMRVEWSSNTYIYNPNNVDTSGLSQGEKAYPIMWVSDIAAGPRLGNYFSWGAPAWNTTPKWYVTYSYELFSAANNVSDVDFEYYNQYFGTYAGNTYGVRWLNFVVLDHDLVDALPTVTNGNWGLRDLPEVGTQAFVDLFADYGYRTSEVRLLDRKPVPDCTSASTGNTTNTTMKSLPNMKPYIGEDWDGATVPNHVDIATNGGYKWTTGAGVDPYPPGIGPGDTSPRLTGNAIWFPQPLNGKILSYLWSVTNDEITPVAQYTWVWSPAGGQAVLNSCSPQLTVVRWFSATPGGQPLLNAKNERKIHEIGDAGWDPTFSIKQLYDLNDSPNESAYIIPVISKRYFLNAACIEHSLLATLQAEGRAPTASEVKVFDPTACGSDDNYAYVVSAPSAQTYNFDTWLQENT